MARRKSEEEAKRLRKYLTRIETAEKWRDNAFKPKWERYYKRYRNYVDQLVDPKTGKPITDRSNISVPYTFVQVETILPRLVETLFAARPYVTVKGRTRKWVNNAEKMQILLDYQHNEVMDIQNLFHLGLKTMAIYGTTVAYVGWKYKKRTVIRKELAPVMVENPETGEKEPLLDVDGVTPVLDYQETEVEDVEYDDPEVKFLDLGNFFVDPNAEDIEDALYAGYNCFMTKEQLEQLAEAEQIKLDWSKIPKDRRQNQARNDRMAQVGLPAPDDDNIQNDENGLFEVHYYYEDDKCVIIINRAYLAKDGPNPFWHKKKPFVKDTYTKVPGEFYGIGIVEITEDQQDELNTERNMRIDYRAHNLRRMFLIRDGAEIDRKELVWRQNGIIKVKNIDSDIKILDAPQIHGDTFSQEEIIKQDMRDATGAHDVVMGTSGSSETATTTMSKDNNASMRFKLIISSAEKKLLVGISRFMIQLNQQFIDNVRVLPLFDEKGDDWPEITPEDIQGEFHLIASGSSVEPMANKEAFKQRMVELYSIAANDPILQQNPIYRRNLLKKVFESFDITDTDDLLPSDEELMGQMQSQIIQQFVASLPPELQQIMAQFQSPQPPPNVTRIGGGANTAATSERGLQLVGGGG